MNDFFWETSMQIPGTPWSICGYSKCAYRTGFYVNGLNILLDAGIQCFKKLDHIFITHTHSDHIAELTLKMIGNHNVMIHCPEKAIQCVENYILALFDANCLNNPDENKSDGDKLNVDNKLERKEKIKLNIVPVCSERTTRRIQANNQKLELDTVCADHSVDTVVYGFSVVKNKLNPMYDGMSGQKIKELKDTGVAVTIEIIEKKFCFVLDTSSIILEMSPFLLEYPVVIIECTFLYDDEVVTATKKKHIHWQQLKPYVIMHPKTQFILTHFSQKYKNNDVKKFFDNVKECENIINVIPWL